MSHCINISTCVCIVILNKDKDAYYEERPLRATIHIAFPYLASRKHEVYLPYYDILQYLLQGLRDISQDVHQKNLPEYAINEIKRSITKSLDALDEHLRFLTLKTGKKDNLLTCNCCNQTIDENPIEDRWGGYICNSCNSSEA